MIVFGSNLLKSVPIGEYAVADISMIKDLNDLVDGTEIIRSAEFDDFVIVFIDIESDSVHFFDNERI